MAMVKRFDQPADIVRRDTTFEAFNAINRNHRDAVAIPLEERGVTANIHLIKGKVEIGRQVFQMSPRIVAQMTAGLRIEQDDGFHVRFFQAAYRSDSGLAHSGG